MVVSGAQFFFVLTGLVWCVVVCVFLSKNVFCGLTCQLRSISIPSFNSACSLITVTVIMVRKRRTEVPGGGESSEPQEAGGGRGSGAQRPPAQHQQQQGGGGRGWPAQTQQGGRGGYGGGRGGAQRGGMAPPQYYGVPPEYHQGRGTQQQPRGGAPSQRRGGMGGGHGVGPAAGGPPRPSVPELHQATQPPHQAGVMNQPVPYGNPADTHSEAGFSSSRPAAPTPQDVSQQFQQLTVGQESASSQAIQPVPASSKSMRFPLRPGKGSYGIRCVVKANHFFAELPDKDLHQYDVSWIVVSISLFWFAFFLDFYIDMSSSVLDARLLSPLRSHLEVLTVLLWNSW